MTTLAPGDENTLHARGEMRRDLLAKRRLFATSLSEKERARQDQALADRIYPHLETARIIGAYIAHGHEISLAPLISRLERDGKMVALPFFASRDAPMEMRHGPAQAIGPFRITQPAPDAPCVIPDVILAPLVGADPCGVRLGRGGGHYDRYLSHLRARQHCRVIGVGYDMQRVPAIPVCDWDERLDALATPDRLIFFT